MLSHSITYFEVNSFNASDCYLIYAFLFPFPHQAQLSADNNVRVTEVY